MNYFLRVSALVLGVSIAGGSIGLEKSIAGPATNDRNAQAISSEGFMMPSKNIYCAISSPSERSEDQFLRCAIVSGLKPMPARPQDGSCNLDWGYGLVLPKTTKTEVLCAGDTIYSPNYPTLDYGKTWKNAGFTCKSERTGVTCTNQKRQGFFLNRGAWRTF